MPLRLPPPAPYALASALALALFAPLATADAGPEAVDLEGVVVTAVPLQDGAEALARPVEVLAGEALDRVKSSSLGETVSRLPGVQTTYFGPGVGRPIIRGQEGPRVQVLAGGIGSMDASTVSADHAVAVEPFLADQIEVLKGPATLLFGSGAIGGAVNVVDGRIASSLPQQPLGGRAELRGNTVNGERSGMFRLDGVNGNWVLHVDGLVRDSDDYKIPGAAKSTEAESDGDEPEEQASSDGTLDNSAVSTRAGAVGATWLGERGHFGLGLSTYRSNYGIPEGAHVHHEDDGHGHEEEEGHADEEGSVRVDMKQDRLELKTGLRDPLASLSSLELHAAHTTYEHVELEDGMPATRFSNKGWETRLQAVQKPLKGWRGAFGLQLGKTDFSAVGAEAFVPSTSTRTLGGFLVEEKDFGAWKVELGARHERVELQPLGEAARDYDASSLSAAAIWRFNEALDFRFGLDSSERAPTNEELFAYGAHVATRSLEIGDRTLQSERGQRVEAGLHAHSGSFDFSFAAYQTRFKDFIYLADTGIEEAELPVRLWTQADATFTGAEAEARLHLLDAAAASALELRVFADYVHARLDGGQSRTIRIQVPDGDLSHVHEVVLAGTGNLPRIAPARIGADLAWSWTGWRASLGAVHYLAQERVAADERSSDSYTLLDAHLAYRWELPAASWEVFLDGNNLGNREIRPHTSLLRDFAPLPGRSLAFGIRAFF
ncbi:MAG: TonB-dependent receptor [Lysobacteraceae bacterium]|nr:MAG: TonB-dependent receptor [Xanthomonadaceae bacterium]